MGYQALLFCPDEKLGRVVAQVFSDLDFSVEAVNEPFGAVKKLMAQRYDAIVVDCENEQNATLLFKSGRNSTHNQNSLAFALVEGQAGVAKAYRIGANLVLTKPINVEQAKGTLRVARGLLRKSTDTARVTPAGASSPAAPSKPTPAAAGAPKPAGLAVETVAPTQAPAGEAAVPAMAALAKAEESPIVAPAPEAKAHVETDSSAKASKLTTHAAETAAPAQVKAASATSPGLAHSAAAAPAPAKETPAPAEKKSVEMESVASAKAASPASTSATVVEGPAFAALKKEGTGGSGVVKKALVAAAVVVVAAGLGYFGWTKLATTGSSLPFASSPRTPASSNAATATGVSPATPPVSTTTAGSSAIPSATTAATSAFSKPSAGTSSASTPKAPPDNETTRKQAEPAPIVVKPNATALRKAPAPAEEAAVQAPNPLAVASPNEGNLSGLVASGPVSLPKAAPTALKISQGVSQGLIIKRVTPRYPASAQVMHLQGSVQLEATINKEGNITNLKALSGDPVLTRAAIEAVRQWRYKPYYLDGAPVEIQTQITVTFKLPN